MPAARSNARNLAKAVAAAFTKAALTPTEQKVGITHPDLPWTCPPLRTHLYLGGIPLQEYYNVPLRMQAENILPFWQEALHGLIKSPGKMVDGITLTCAKRLLPTERPGSRAFTFSVPNGYPADIDEMSGVVLSLELAHAVYHSVPVAQFVSNDSDFYVELQDGTIVGVQGGRPAIDCGWDFDASGMLPDLLAMPRGAVTSGCWFDSLAYARSMLYTYKRRFPEFEAVDSGIQALRYLTMGGVAPELLLALQVSPHVQMQTGEKVRQLEDAVAALDHSMCDRDKLSVIRAALVPGVISATEFRLKVFSSPDVPFMLDPTKMEKIGVYLRAKLDELRATM